jgi:hypothetical protein
LIEHLRTYLGYCGQCGQPTEVGDYRLRGWKHVFPICTECLVKLTERQKPAAENGASS